MKLPNRKKKRGGVPILGREACPPQNKTGQSWKLIIEKEYDEYGYPIRYVNKGPQKCPGCGGIIRYDKRGFAACDCGLIWNDRPERPISEADLQANLEKWAPRACKIEKRRTYNPKFMTRCIH